MSGVTPIDSMAEGLKQAFEDFSLAYRLLEKTRSSWDYFSQPVVFFSDMAAFFSGHSVEHALQEKLLGELKIALDERFSGATGQENFFNYLVAFKLIERLNRSVLAYLDGTGPDGKEVPKDAVGGLNFVPLYAKYKNTVLRITSASQAEISTVLENIDEHILDEDLVKMRSPSSEATGAAAYFKILLTRLSQSLWTAEQQRAFGIEQSEGLSAAGTGAGGASATPVLDVCRQLDGTAAVTTAPATPTGP